MTRAVAHRGPDGESVEHYGPAVLGHRRLSILDPTAAGDQPMAYADGNLHLIHNGEIYNFLELRRELESLGQRFTTETDTEVILAAYDCWGTDAAERFNGIWAFALWDKPRQMLWLSRDRLGVKPMFILERPEMVAFASELKALLPLAGAAPEPDPKPVRDFLLTGQLDAGDQTFFRGIRRLAPGANFTITAEGRRTWRYWNPDRLSRDAAFADDGRDRQRVDEFRELLTDAVALQLRSDVALGSCLSGGLDSSSVVSLTSRIRGGAAAGRDHSRDQHPQFAFFARFEDPGIDESRYVEAVAAASGVPALTTTPTSAQFAAALEDVAWHQDEPFGSSSIVAQYFVMELAHEHGIKVLLDGQGADEMLAGYPANAGPRYGGAVRRGAWRDVLLAARRRELQTSLPRVLWYAAAGAHQPPAWLRPSRALRPRLGEALRVNGSGDGDASLPPGTVLGQNMLRDLVATHLPALLRYEDRNSMAFGIEARVPFLDHRLVEFSLGLPDRLKIAGRERKVVLRRAMDGIVPDAVLARRDKIGFEAPEARWLRESRPSLTRLAERPESERMGLLKPGTISWALGQLDRERPYGSVFWRVLSLELWLRVSVRGQRGLLGSSRHI
jgi:asparagine synthase (glutamine-hydrolysing)